MLESTAKRYRMGGPPPPPYGQCLQLRRFFVGGASLNFKLCNYVACPAPLLSKMVQSSARPSASDAASGLPSENPLGCPQSTP